jgi:hypothetical protein
MIAFFRAAQKLGFASQAGCRPRPPGDTPVPVFFFGTGGQNLMPS